MQTLAPEYRASRTIVAANDARPPSRRPLRIFAFAIDIALLAAIAFVAILAAYAVRDAILRSTTYDTVLRTGFLWTVSRLSSLWLSLIAGVVAIVYFVVVRGRTIGRRVTALRPGGFVRPLIVLLGLFAVAYGTIPAATYLATRADSGRPQPDVPTFDAPTNAPDASVAPTPLATLSPPAAGDSTAPSFIDGPPNVRSGGAPAIAPPVHTQGAGTSTSQKQSSGAQRQSQ